MEYSLHILILIAIYATLATSLNLVVGEIGLLSITQASFFGIGAYTTAILSVEYNVPTELTLLVGMAIAAATSVAVSVSTARVTDDYFAVATFGFQIIVFSVLNNWVSLTRGPYGIANIPDASFFGWVAKGHIAYFFLTAAWLGTTILIAALISESPFGRVLRAIREQETFAQAFGKNTLRFKMTTFAVSAALAASAGTLYAHYIGFIDPTSFTVMDSILVLSMVIIGGAAHRWGPSLGAAVLIAFPELIRFVGLPSSAAANLRAIAYGLLLIIVMRLRPLGLANRSTPGD